MSENGNLPVVVESPDPLPEAGPEAPAQESTAVATVEEPEPEPEVTGAPRQPASEAVGTGEPTTEVGSGSDPVPVEEVASTDAVEVPTAESARAEAVEASGAETKDAAGSEAKEAAPEGAKRTRKGKKPKRRRSARSEEFVAPTPEDLEGLTSAAVRVAIESEQPVEGQIIGWNQGGFHVVVDGITAFCPRSSMELGAPHEPARYLDQTFQFRVLRVEEKGHRLILSRAAALRQERRLLAEETRGKIELGAVLEGRVVALTDFGAFVDLGGVEGLVHVSELRHTRVAKPADVLEVGQTVTAKVIKLGTKSDRVSLSLKALEPDPWQLAAETWPSGSEFTGKILRKTEFGWFIELAPGVEGLLHVSQLKPGMAEDDPALEPGQEIEGWVRELDRGRHRVSLSLREAPQGNPWEGVAKRYPEGATVKGTVEKLERFGAFILLEPGLTGLLPTSEMGLPRGANPARSYRIGKEVKLQVAQVDPRRKRISLTLEGKTLEGSRSDYQAYLKKSRRSDGLSTLAAAFERMRTDR